MTEIETGKVAINQKKRCLSLWRLVIPVALVVGMFPLFQPAAPVAANPAFTARTETYVNVSTLSSPYNITVTNPTGTTDGDILFCWIGWYNTTGRTIDSVPSGWTLLGQNIANTDRYALYYKIAFSEPASWVWSFNNSCKVRAVCSIYTSGDFDASDPIDVVSNTSYRINNTTSRAASMTVSEANSPLIFWGGVYANNSVRTFTKPSVPTTGWVEDDDAGNTTSDFSTEVCSYIWSGSGATGDMDAIINSSATTKHAFAVALNPPSGATVDTIGTQTASMNIPGTGQYVGGAFTITESTGSRNVTGITIAEQGTVDAQTNLANIKLFYDLDTTAPYDGASESYGGGESQFGSTTSFNGDNGTASFTSSVGISTTQTMVVYVVLDVGSGASVDQTLEIQITDPSTQVTVDGGGTVAPATAVAIAGTTMLTNSPPSTPTIADTPAFTNLKTNDTTPILGNFSTTDPESNSVEYEIQWDDDYSFGSPVTMTSSSYPTDAGWTAATFSSGASTSYIVQAGDALTNDTTYWWRVRARDPSGSNTWSSYSSLHSLTVDTSISLNGWFQTTDEQFDTGTLTDVETSSGSLQLGASAIAKAGTDTSETGTASPLSFSHTLVAGSNRLVVVSIGIENSGDYDVASVTYGGQSMTKAVDQASGTSGFIELCEIWYILDANLPGDGSQTVTVTGSGTASSMEINGFCAEYTGVTQEAPEVTDGVTQTSGATITNTISPSTSAWVISVAGSGNAGSWTHGESQVEVLDFNDSSSCFAVAELRGANGETSLSSTYSSTVNRLVRVAASFTAVSISSGTITSPSIDYDWVSGATMWYQLSWNDDETTGDIKYQVQYWDGDSWELIPDGALSGNSTGFDTSPVNLPILNTTTYNQLRIKANLTNVGGTPYLQSWAISWGAFSWESYRESGHSTVWGTIAYPYDSTFSTAFLYGDGYITGHSYSAGFYDANGTKIATDSAGPLGGTTFDAELPLNADPEAVAGTWHAVVFDSASGSPPETYAACSSATGYLTEDDFEVGVNAIPEFPTVFASIGVMGLCAFIYYRMRKKANRKVQVSLT